MNRIKDFLSKTAVKTNVIPKVPLLINGDKNATNPKYVDQLKREAEVGSTVFGPIPKNHQREFFMLDANTWLWYEEWVDIQGTHSVTTRYELKGKRIYKIQDDHPAIILTGHELKNFHDAVMSYYYQVADKVYGRPIQA